MVNSAYSKEKLNKIKTNITNRKVTVDLNETNFKGMTEAEAREVSECGGSRKRRSGDSESR